ncbi:UV-resistance associated gene [Rhynchophorus ferrugineus]|uniref:UV-resistance associated gene n=1 Tax=Rhynchophorus ferrugineus TaxID=354439 RepID=UPI003FCC89F8
MSFVVSDFSLGRQRCRQWASLISQQLRLRHVDQIHAYNLPAEKRSSFYFTLHKTCMSSPFYTSEKICSKHPKWTELILRDVEGHISSVVIRIWKHARDNDEIIITLGVHFSGLVYLGSKIADLHPRYFKLNTVIFSMQGGYFTSHTFIRNDLDGALPFQKHLNLIEKDNNELVLYRRVAIKAPKGEVQNTYTLDKLKQLHDLQRLIKNKNEEVKGVVEKIHKATECDQKKTNESSTSSDSVRFAPQLLTMNSLNKMLHSKPTKKEREKMQSVAKQIEESKFRIKLLSQERDKKKSQIRSLKQKHGQISDDNVNRQCNLTSAYHTLSKNIEKFKEYKHNYLRHKELFLHTTKQIQARQKQLLKELLFLYPIEKIPNENKYTMLGIYLPNSEILTDCSDPGISVVLGYLCHILIMCSMFLQVPLRYPVKHYGSRSVIYDHIWSLIPDKDREFPLYTKGKDKASFGYAVFLLNQNISQLRRFFYQWSTNELKETLKNMYSFLLGNDRNEVVASPFHEEVPKRLNADYSGPAESASSERLKEGGPLALDKLVSLSLSSSSSTNINDPLLETILEEIRQNRRSAESAVVRSPSRRLSFFKSTTRHSKKEVVASRDGSSEALAVPEAYLNKQISKDVFDRFAAGLHSLPGDLEGLHKNNTGILVKDGVEEFKANSDPADAQRFDSIEQGTDPLDPSSGLHGAVTKSIRIRMGMNQPETKGISRSAGSYVDEQVNGLVRASLELGSDPLIHQTVGDTGAAQVPIRQPKFFEKWLRGDSNLLLLPDGVVSDEELRASLQDVSRPLTARTDRLLSTNQSFNLVKHRNLD